MVYCNISIIVDTLPFVMYHFCDQFLGGLWYTAGYAPVCAAKSYGCECDGSCVSLGRQCIERNDLRQRPRSLEGCGQ